MDRIYNFSAGPAMLPLPALKQAQEDMLNYNNSGMSVMEMSHRSKPFEAIIAAAEANLRSLLNIPANYRVLFLQGGASLQFAMLPMNLAKGKSVDYIVDGTWSKTAMGQAKTQTTVRACWDGSADNFIRTPEQSELDFDPNAAYVYHCCNETIQGVQFKSAPKTPDGVPLLCDASSDFLHKPIDINDYGCIFACAQKNIGPAGVTIVVMREDLLDRCPAGLPSMLDYKLQNEKGSMHNTPPTFAVYMVKLVTDWLINEIGGLDKMYAINQKKAAMLYEAVDTSEGFYIGHAKPECRSIMNVPFRMQTPEQDAQFLSEATAAGLCSLKGHRSVGGCRASIYNAMPVEGVIKLRDFMLDFQKKNRK